jgi:hypothetical protein
VGAGLLAMQATRFYMKIASSLIASKPAPTGNCVYPAHKKTGLSSRFFYA